MKLLKLLIYLGLLFFILFNPVIAHAESRQIYEVNSTVLNVRSEPALNSDIVGLLTKGNKLTVFQERFGWLQTYYKGQEAWVAKHHLIPLTSHNSKNENSNDNRAIQTSSESLTITASSINIRSGPGTNHSIVSSAFLGEDYQIVNAEGDWYQITYNGGSTGWVASWLTNKSASSNTSKVEDKISSNTVNQTSVNKTLAGYTIVLDPGHGGYDSGAIGLTGVSEKSLTSITTDYVAEELRKAGANVIITRSGDYFVSLAERTQISNSYHTDAFISLHYNAFPILSAQGISTYYASNIGRDLAGPVQASLSSATNLSDRGILQENFYVLRNTNAPAILIELGFITNPYDLHVVQGSNYQRSVAVAITNGLINYFH